MDVEVVISSNMESKEAISKEIPCISEEIPNYNKETEEAIAESRNIMKGIIKVKSFDSAEKLFAELDSE